MWAKILQAATEPSLLPLALVLLTKSQNCFIVLTSSNLLDGFVALNRSVSRVAAWFTLDLVGDVSGDEWSEETTESVI